MIKFTVLGEPKSQPRPRIGRNKRMYDPACKDKDTFAVIAQQYAPMIPMEGPIKIKILCYFNRPKSHYRSGKYSEILRDTAPRFVTKLPDIDNLMKFVMDALTGIYWKDDRQIFCGMCIKEYSEQPRTEVIIENIEEQE